MKIDRETQTILPCQTPAIYYCKRVRHTPRWACVILGDWLYRLGLWRLGDKKVRQYITEGMR